MSQTTFLESVVSWDLQKCQQNLNDALPKLFTCLQSAEIIQEQVGVLKIICQLFLPCVRIEETEDKVFRHIVKNACASFDSILDDLKQIDLNQDVSVLKEKVLGLLELLSDILDCYEVCVKYVSSTDNLLPWNNVQSLPKGAIQLLKGTYRHCKESSGLYGDLLVHISDPLSALFRKAHGLQVAFLNLLDKITIEGNASDKEIQDLCLVCYGLFEVCQIVNSLDVKLVVTLWKAISKHAIQKKDLLKNHLNIDDMIGHLCSEISNSYTYLFQLLPHVNEDGIVLSQGDEKGFQKSVKILGFQMKIMVSLVREYRDYLSECGSDVYKVLIHLQRMMPPSIHIQKIEDHHADEIQRQLLNATEPLIHSLLTNKRFVQHLTSCASVNQLVNEDCLSHLLLVVMVMDTVPKLSDEEKDVWLSPKNFPEDDRRYNLIEALFYVVKKNSLELALPVYVSGLNNTHRKEKSVCLYDEVCVHLCGLIGSLPSKYFVSLEKVLIENVLCSNIATSQLAADAWCFLVRYGTAELCEGHVKVLLEVLQNISGHTVQYRNLVVLVNRMIKFLAKEHQTDIMKMYQPSSHMTLWSVLSISGFTSSNARNLVEMITHYCIKMIHNFINTTEKRTESFMCLNSALDGLINIFTDSNVSEKYLTPEVLSAIVDKTIKLCNSFSDWTVLPVTRLCFGKLIQLMSFFLQNLNNKEILQVLMAITTVTKQTSDQHFKLCVAKFLHQLGKVRLAASFEQSQILNRIPVIFNSLLSDPDLLVKHVALNSFTKFAEITIHESIVPQCIQANSQLQDSVVAFLNKTPYPCDVIRKEYLLQMLSEKSPVDTETDEPSSKRPRTELSDGLASNISVTTNMQSKLIVLLKTCLERLQENNEVLSNSQKTALRETRDMLNSFLDENG